MTDDNQSEGKEEAVPTSQEETPTETQTETQPPEGQDEEKQEDTPLEETQEEGLPEGVKERTKEQFDKLQQQLKEERSKNAQGTSVFNSFRGPQPQVEPQQNPFNQPQVEEPLVDEDGTVDIDRVNQSFTAAQQAQQRALDAEQRIIHLEEDRQTREAHEAHPELDPQSDDFDQQFFDMASAQAALNYINGGKKSIKQIGDDIKDFRSSNSEVKQAKKEAIKDFKESQSKRKQGPIEEGSGEDRMPDVSQEELQKRTREGDGDALSQRLKNIGM